MTQVHRTTDQFFVFFIHSRWFAKCGFVRLVKGDEFIARCLAERPTQENSQPQQQAGSQQQQVRDKVQRAALGRTQGFVKVFFRVPQADGP